MAIGAHVRIGRQAPGSNHARNTALLTLSSATARSISCYAGGMPAAEYTLAHLLVTLGHFRQLQ